VTKTGVAAAIGAVILAAAALVGWDTVSTPSSAPASTTALDGAALFQAKGCATCHTGPDSQALFLEFPNLSDAASFAGERRSGMSAEEYLTESIRVPNAFISPAFRPNGPTANMPTLNLSDAEIEALVSYLLSD
jgi:mono/diheme cytochrome c family protein